ncbi:3-hydroxyacyl-CoA dehydrogenase family protein [Actinoplanes sp. N902-109]|uniref:3-hydroxyacyl-CoA dehydrogenase family protein n=1 Tax=Actinoplanes sp. (strain N902-109) TaxID=649831 RepID=UPI000329603B|nr:3-hydroxyacyl-CoA dehydrogenase family protein [Actinoplanes sp. N902-109]AGL14996.1 putative 3-hydroxybutyryl-CoA dehydrogenase [Actinoplanes sp. N902-109]
MSETPPHTVGVVGAGTIGSSVAHAAATAGLSVVLVDRTPAALAAAVTRIRGHQRLARLTGGEVTELDLRTTTELGELSGVDIVVENITENEQAKAALYAELDEVLKPGVAIAANTSAIPIDRLAAPLTDPARVAGVHFMNPVARIGTVEVVRGPQTAGATLAAVAGLLTRMGKQWVTVNDAAGFVINRVLMVVCNLAAALVDEGVASPGEVDTLFRGCLGHRTGPLRTADLIGIDTVVDTLDVLHAHHGTAEYVAHPALRAKVAAGHLGQKSGAGYFTYGES